VRHRGFTLIEILMVVVIIAILVGLLVPSVALLQRMRSKAVTERLLNNVVFAMTKYMDANPVIDPATEAVLNCAPPHQSEPWPLLGLGSVRYLELPHRSLGDGAGRRVQAPADGRTILDGFSTPIVVRLAFETVNNRRVLSRMEIASRNGSNHAAYPDPDDIIWRYDSERDAAGSLSADEFRNAGKFWRMR
jgi:prepilin-type N-terminal cleavage/methylation domain-containing protein